MIKMLPSSNWLGHFPFTEKILRVRTPLGVQNDALSKWTKPLGSHPNLVLVRGFESHMRYEKNLFRLLLGVAKYEGMVSNQYSQKRSKFLKIYAN